MTFPKTRRVLGVDPGTANLGLACVAADPATGGLSCVGVRFCGTKPNRHQRIAAVDDAHRLLVMAQAVDQAITEWAPDLVVVEWYAPRQGAQRHGWKTVLVVGATVAIAWAHELACRPQLPKHLRQFTQAGDKAGVVKWTTTNVAGMAKALRGLPASKHEHVADAAGHACLALALPE